MEPRTIQAKRTISRCKALGGYTLLTVHQEENDSVDITDCGSFSVVRHGFSYLLASLPE